MFVKSGNQWNPKKLSKVKLNGVWKPVAKEFYKRNGVWVSGYVPPVDPYPDTITVTLNRDCYMHGGSWYATEIKVTTSFSGTWKTSTGGTNYQLGEFVILATAPSSSICLADTPALVITTADGKASYTTPAVSATSTTSVPGTRIK